MAAADVVRTYKDSIEPYLNLGGPAKPAESLLYQLLLKGSSNDKKFVVEEAKTTLNSIAEGISPMLLLDHTLPYADHKSPKVRYTNSSKDMYNSYASRLCPAVSSKICMDQCMLPLL